MAKIDDSVKKKVPELRFKGFTDDWEERKLGDEVRIVMGQSPNSENYTDDPNDYILVQGNADMKNGRVLPRVWTTQVTKQAEKDDLILSVRAPVGDIGKTAYDVVIGRGVAAIKGNEFIFQNLGKMKSDGYWTRYSTGSTFESINSTDIKEAIISVPAIEEQDKIGSFFKQLDETIALHQRKLDLLKEQKKGFLQKMFPKNGAKVPELRFAGFADDWEQHKLGDLATSFEYGLNASAKSFDGTHKYIRITDIDDSSRKFNSQSLTSPDIDLSSADNHKLKNGDILFARTGASVGKSYIYADSDGLVYYAGFLIRARIKSGVDSNFVFQHTLTSSYENFIRVTSQRSGQPGVNAKEYSTFEISVPSYEEQRKIGSFFKQLDDTIDLHQRKLDLLKEQKKGFLQKMFV
ncbi:restriction endonuclease subunit S [Lactococcus lactis]|uniref:restriction endonuclease subunit S n=1 Tax=Lactococcus lactis TaxID=1358 RepID=UPI002079139D|nr:restriction endonuclease subunit S [Lactococcus lactis]USI61955.1 restriction endonuclease subunit S [Lactococcus lactis subsp. lactis]